VASTHHPPKLPSKGEHGSPFFITITAQSYRKLKMFDFVRKHTKILMAVMFIPLFRGAGVSGYDSARTLAPRWTA
jgi:hypothetical protein